MFQLILFALLFGLFVYRRMERMSTLERSGIPGPKPSLITGNYFDFFSKPNVLKLSEYYAKYGKVFGYYLGRQMVVNVTDLNLIREIQVKSFSQFSSKETPELRFGVNPDPEMHRNILTLDGASWKASRTILSNAFNGERLKSATPCINSCTQVLMGKVEEQHGSEFNICDHFKPLTMDVMSKVLLGVDGKFQTQPAKSVKRTDGNGVGLMAAFLWFSEFDFILYYVRRPIQIVTDLYDSIVKFNDPENVYKKFSYDGRPAEKVISNEISLQSKSPTSKLMQSIGGGSSSSQYQMTSDASYVKKFNDPENEYKKYAYFDRAPEKVISNEITRQSKSPTSKLMQSIGGGGSSSQQYQMTSDEAMANGSILYTNGSRITSNALAFVFHFIVNHPEVQAKVRQEITDHLSEEGTKKFDHESMSKLTYLQAVIYETLRCLPPLTTATTRSSSEDFHYKDIVLPKKSLIRVPLHQLHHTEEYWPQHDQFNPDRFLDKSNMNSIAFQPFGAGPRICLGARFAMLEMKLILAQLLSKYEFIPGASTEKELTMHYGHFDQTPANGVWLKAVPIN